MFGDVGVSLHPVHRPPLKTRFPIIRIRHRRLISTMPTRLTHNGRLATFGRYILAIDLGGSGTIEGEDTSGPEPFPLTLKKCQIQFFVRRL